VHAGCTHVATAEFDFYRIPAGNEFEGCGAKYLSEALQHNSTLIQLYVCGAYRIPIEKPTDSNIYTDNQLRAEGVKYLSEALKFNTTLLHLNLQCKCFA